MDYRWSGKMDREYDRWCKNN